MGRKEAERPQASVNQLGIPQRHFIVYAIKNKVEVSVQTKTKKGPERGKDMPGNLYT